MSISDNIDCYLFVWINIEAFDTILRITCKYHAFTLEKIVHISKKNNNKKRNTHSSIANSSCCYALVFSFPCSHKKSRFKTWRSFSKFTCWYFCREIWLWSVVCKSLKQMHLYLSDRTKTKKTTKLQIHIFTYACLHKAYIPFFIVFYFLLSGFVYMCKNKIQCILRKQERFALKIYSVRC